MLLLTLYIIIQRKHACHSTAVCGASLEVPVCEGTLMTTLLHIHVHTLEMYHSSTCVYVHKIYTHVYTYVGV